MDDEFIGEHGIRLDLVARTSTNEILNIVLRKQLASTEATMQKKNDVLREQIVADQTDVDSFDTCCSSEATNNMYKRSLFYWAKLYSSQLKKGQYYKDLHPVIAINILDFNLFEDNRCNRNFILKDEKTNEEYIRIIEIHFVELNKRRYIDQSDDLWLWVEFLKTPNSGCMEQLCEKTNSSSDVSDAIRSVADAKNVYDKTIANPVEQTIANPVEQVLHMQLFPLGNNKISYLFCVATISLIKEIRKL